MAAAVPPPPEPPRGESAGAKVERYGPLEVRRLVKDDGRSLVLYNRAGTTGRTDR